MNFHFYLHHLLILLGWRQSISSLLRQCLLPPSKTSIKHSTSLPNLEVIERDLPSKISTAAYLIFSDGAKTIAMEKDHRTAVTRSAHYFIAATNHDVTDESPKPRLGVSKTSAGTLKLTGMEGLVEESIDRKKCISQLWYRATNTRRKKYARRGKESVIDEGFVSTETVCDWMDEYPVTNEETHFAVVMDPKEGQIVWIKRYLEPVVHD